VLPAVMRREGHVACLLAVLLLTSLLSPLIAPWPGRLRRAPCSRTPPGSVPRSFLRPCRPVFGLRPEASTAAVSAVATVSADAAASVS